MSWLFSRALVAAYSEHTSSESIRYALSREMSTVDAFSCAARMTASFPLSRYGMTFVLLPEAAGPELLTSYLADSPARHSAGHRGGGLPQKTSGPQWRTLFARPAHPMCLPRTSPPPQLKQRPRIAPRWATKPRCFPFQRQTWVLTTFGPDIGYLHTPTTKANYSAPSMQKWPACRNFTQAFGRPCPGNQEWLMGYPEGWSDTKPLETGKFQSWRRRLCGHLQMLKQTTIEEAA